MGGLSGWLIKTDLWRTSHARAPLWNSAPDSGAAPEIVLGGYVGGLSGCLGADLWRTSNAKALVWG